MQTSRTSTRNGSRWPFIVTGILGIGLFVLLMLASLSGPQSAAAYIPGPDLRATAAPTSSSNPGVNINFQPAASAPYPGYLVDSGAVYGPRDNGWTYGWNLDNSAASFERNVAADQRYDTGISIHHNQPGTVGLAGVWEIALPTGWYSVILVVGDPSFVTNPYSIVIEGVQAMYGAPATPSTSIRAAPTVRVTDGRLTITSGMDASNNKLNFLQIIPLKSPIHAPLYHTARINFQPATAVPALGYLVDSGQVYGDRGSGWTYGWDADNTARMVDRNSVSDQRYDTFGYFKKDGVRRTWEMALPEGWYWVTIAGGDPVTGSATVIGIQAEGVPVTTHPTASYLKWVEGHAAVYVSDGRLTLTSSLLAEQTLNKINFIEISQGEDYYRNVAMGKQARMTPAYEDYYSWRANDGNTNPSLSGGSVSMTSSVAEAFWEVDLGAIYSLSLITLYNRNTHRERMDNFYILVSDKSFGSNSLSVARSQLGVSSYYVANPFEEVMFLPVDRTGRYVRIQLTGTNYLQLAEVEVEASLPTVFGLRAQYRAGDTSTLTNAIKPHLNIVNAGPASVVLSDLKARYYYTREGTSTERSFCDYAVVGCGNITGSLGNINELRYLDVGFTTGAGTLAAGAQTGEIQMRFSKTDWSNYDQSNDYSFNRNMTVFADWGRVRLYHNSSLIWGSAP